MSGAALARIRSPWFHSAAFDLLLILCVPIATWPLVLAGQQTLGAPLLNQLILLTATGHYFATFVRTYGDRDLFQRFRTRLLLAPPLLLLLCVAMFATGHAAPLLLATTGWAFWHWLAQAFGFARIYDAKVGSVDARSAWLDKALVVTGFVAAVVLNPASTATFGKVFLDAGLPLPGASTYAVVQDVTRWTALAVLAAYLANLAAAIAGGRPWSWQKQLMHATTIGYYWFAFAWLPNVLVAYVLYELFHDVQYFAITWLACRGRVQRPGTAPWLQRLFRPGLGAAAVFLGVMLACGAVDWFGRNQWLPNGRGHDVWLGMFLATALLHYYFDGFVWKAREQTIGRDLGLASGLAVAVVPTLRHAALWSLFALPMGVAWLWGGPPPNPRERAAALVAVAPGDFLSQTELAYELAKAGDLPGALRHYQASVAANPDFAQSRVNFGAALDLSGDLDGARQQYEQALRCPDRDGAHRTAHTNLGVLLLTRGDPAAAAPHLAAARRLGGEPPIGRLLGLAAAVPQDAVARRRALYQAALRLDANQPDALYNLGLLALAQRQFVEATTHLDAVVRLVPDFAAGLLAAARAHHALGRDEVARPLVQRVLQREPAHAEAQALLRELPPR
jgi:Tfp pilus assembly protein PilF